MDYKQVAMPKRKRIAVIAHDNMKQDLLEWTRQHLEMLKHHHLYATGTTGHLLENDINIQATQYGEGHRAVPVTYILSVFDGEGELHAELITAGLHLFLSE